MGLSRLTALEIFAHPKDLYLCVACGKEFPDKFGFVIARGPGHEYKFLVTCLPVLNSRAGAVKAIVSILNSSVEEGMKTWSGDNPVTRVYNPDRHPVEAFPALTAEFVAAIEKRLADNDEVETRLVSG